MQGEGLDAYCVKYKGLVVDAGLNLCDQLCLKIFTDGLPHDLYQDKLHLNNPQNYEEWKEAVLQ
jgi:hypothetical protein